MALNNIVPYSINKTITSFARFVFWEADDNYIYNNQEHTWYESLIDPQTDFAAYDTNYFFDEEIVFYQTCYFANKALKRWNFFQLWSFFDHIQVTPLVLGSTFSYLVTTTSINLRFQRRKKVWRSFFGLTRFFLWSLFFFFQKVFFIQLSVVGVGFSCEPIDTHQVRLLISNTNDLILLSPQNIELFIIPPVGDSNAITTFCCTSSDYLLLRQYAHYIRNLLKFNVYEYKGLLFLYEIKKKKLTKRKVK